MIGHYLIFLSAIFCLFLVVNNISASIPDIKYTSIFSLLIWIGWEITSTFEFVYDQMVLDMIHITALSLVLIILLMVIRRLRPIIFRYPLYLAFTPLLIPFAQYLVIDTHLIKDIIFMSAQGVAIVVFFFIMLGYEKEIKEVLVSILGVLLLVASFLIFWFLRDQYLIHDIVWQLLLVFGMIISVSTFSNRIDEKLKMVS